MSDVNPSVYIVDDDSSVFAIVEVARRVAGWQAHIFGSGGEFLSQRVQAPCCLVLDLHLPDLNGLDVQKLVGRSLGDAGHFHHRTRRCAHDGSRQ
jgi:FixJ family two-component response regulator